MAVEIDAIQSAKSIGWSDALLTRLGANSVALGARLSITAPANSSALSSTGYSLTGSNAQSMIDLAGTWNTTGTPTLIKANVTDTASNASSLLIDLQVGGVTQLNASKTGGLTSAITGSARVIQWNGNNNYIGSTSNQIIISSYGGALNVSNTIVSTTLPLGIGGVIGQNAILIGEAANTLALRNGANAQAFNIYNTYTSGSVFERGFMRWVSNVLEIGTEHVGASARGISFKTGGTERIGIGAAGIVAVTGGVTATSYVWPSYLRLAASDFAHIYAPANGVVTLYNTTEADFNRLQFGGITSSFPSIKRSTTILQARLADDSDFGTYQGKLRVHANATSETVTPTHTLRLFDAAGTEYRVPAIAV